MKMKIVLKCLINQSGSENYEYFTLKPVSNVLCWPNLFSLITELVRGAMFF